MSSRTLFRLSGLALLIALPLQILGFALHSPSDPAGAGSAGAGTTYTNRASANKYCK